MRARVEGRSVSSVEVWGNGIDGLVDVTLGDDGDLYYVSHHGDGVVYRARFRADSQALVVSRSHLFMLEGGLAFVSVRLAQAPSEDVAVSVARVSGDSDLGVADGATLRFGPGDWATPKPVRFFARADADAVDDSAVFEVSAAGLPSETVTLRATDEILAEPPGDGGAGGEAGADSGAAGEGGQGLGGGAGGGDSTAGEAMTPEREARPEARRAVVQGELRRPAKVAATTPQRVRAETRAVAAAPHVALRTACSPPRCSPRASCSGAGEADQQARAAERRHTASKALVPEENPSRARNDFDAIGLLQQKASFGS